MKGFCLLLFIIMLIFSVYIFYEDIIKFLPSHMKIASGNTSFTDAFHVNKYPPAKTVNKDEETRIRIILLWNFPSTYYFVPILKKSCGKCLITEDHRMEVESDAIVFHFRTVKKVPDQKIRRKNQIYVWLCKESPWTTKHVDRISFNGNQRNFFNATMTFRKDSTISLPYLEVVHRHPQQPTSNFISFYHRDVNAVLSSKRYKVLWVVKNCDTHGALHRYRYVTAMIEAGLQVSVFGKCFHHRRQFPPFRSKAASKRRSLYKFYISFENSYHCREYVTEKFWDNSIYHGAIPIVWGPSQDDLKDLAPPHSYIHTEDFNNDIRELVDYIEYVDRNEKEYLKYFQWRLDLQEMDVIMNEAKRNNDSYDDDSRFKELAARFSNYKLFLKDRRFGLCSLCHHLHSGRQFPPLKSMQRWWYGSENNACLRLDKPKSVLNGLRSS